MEKVHTSEQQSNSVQPEIYPRKRLPGPCHGCTYLSIPGFFTDVNGNDVPYLSEIGTSLVYRLIEGMHTFRSWVG